MCPQASHSTKSSLSAAEAIASAAHRLREKPDGELKGSADSYSWKPDQNNERRGCAVARVDKGVLGSKDASLRQEGGEGPRANTDRGNHEVEGGGGDAVQAAAVPADQDRQGERKREGEGQEEGPSGRCDALEEAEAVREGARRPRQAAHEPPDADRDPRERRRRQGGLRPPEGLRRRHEGHPQGPDDGQGGGTDDGRAGADGHSQ
mmetsp:Transcript_11326/g.28132  ORF Transcript_11326/g.28132 Transcript_11326/m.28132 type:complete len:206 (+) Transcript_11326:759-1376(+)